MSRIPLGAILAGGRSQRFGRPKAAAEIGGQPIIERVRQALHAAVDEVVLIANQPALLPDLGLPVRPDRLMNAGALGGIHAALTWAREQGRPGALCVACDMPFLSAPLLSRLVEVAARSGAEIVAPESGGPLRCEPLCAVYSVRCLPEIERRIHIGQLALGSLLQEADVAPFPLGEVMHYGCPETLFFNVNTPAQYEAARRIAARKAAHVEH